MSKPILFFCIVFLSACSYIPQVPVSVSVNASSTLNTSSEEESLPVRVKVYQLAEIAAFKEATFRELWKRDKEVLGDSLLSMKAMTISPNSHQTLKFTRKEGANYLGVMAVFRRPAGSRWRDFQPLPSQASTLIHSSIIRLKGNTVEIK